MKLFCLLAFIFGIFISYINGVPPEETTYLKNNLDDKLFKDVETLKYVTSKPWESNAIFPTRPTRTPRPLHSNRKSNQFHDKQQGLAYLGPPTEKYEDALLKIQSIKVDFNKQSNQYNKGILPDDGRQGRRNIDTVTHNNHETNASPLITEEERITVNLLEEMPISISTRSFTSTTSSTSTKTTPTTTTFTTTSTSSTTTKTTPPSTTTQRALMQTTRRHRQSTTKKNPTSVKMRKDNIRSMGLKSGRSIQSARRENNEPNFRGKSTQMMDGEPAVQDAPLSPYTLRGRLEEILDLPKYNDVEVKIETLTKTSEYNEVIMLSLSSNITEKKARMRSRKDKYVEEEPKKKYLFIVHGLDVLGIRHIPALSMEAKFISLLDYYVKHLDKFNIFLIPMANPDGFQRTLSDPKWAKNVSPQDDCLGVALDRNFEVGWNISRKLSSCSQTFPGNVAFTEPETMAIRDIMHFHSTDIYAYIHVHAASPGPSIFKGDALLTAPGFTKTLSNDDRYVDLKGDITEGLRNASLGKTTVTIDTMHKWYGAVAGTSADYAAMVYGIPFGLEMLMQAYYVNDFNLDDNGSVDMQDLALKHVWKKMIDITFKSLYKTLRKCQKEKQDEDVNSR